MKNVTLSLLKATLCAIAGAAVLGATVAISCKLINEQLNNPVDTLSDSEAELLEKRIKNGAR